MLIFRKLLKSGGSYIITFNIEFMNAMGYKFGDVFEIEIKNNKIILNKIASTGN